MVRLPIEQLALCWQMFALWVWAPRASSLILLAGGNMLIVPSKQNSRLLSSKKVYVDARCILGVFITRLHSNKARTFGYAAMQASQSPNPHPLREGDVPALSFFGPGDHLIQQSFDRRGRGRNLGSITCIPQIPGVPGPRALYPFHLEDS